LIAFKTGGPREILVEALGWYGLVAVVLAYGSVSLSFISPTSYIYQFLNLSGSIGLGLVAFVKRAYQNGVLNIVWGAIAVVAILRLVL
jgi:predicted DNA repair protein MutK